MRDRVSSANRHKGVAIIMVLLMLSTVLGMSYVLLSTASSSAASSGNSAMVAEARSAAMSGEAIAFQKLTANDWPGVGSSYTQSLGDGITYSATYTIGNAALPSNDPDQALYVTITVVGLVANPTFGADSTHTTQSVVRLVPKVADPQPADWSTFLNYTVYQTESHDSEVQLPCRIEGNLRLQKKLKLCEKYPPSSNEFGGDRVLFVVVNPASPTSQEALRTVFMLGAGLTVNLIDESASQAAFDAAIDDNDVVYVSEEVYSPNLNTKVSNFPFGVVCEEYAMWDDLGLAAASTNSVNDKWCKITDDSHFITSQWSVNDNLKIFTSNEPLHRLAGSVSPDLLILGQVNNGDSLGVLESGLRRHDSGYTTGHRILLPWGGGALDFGKLDADGEEMLLRSLVWGATENPRRRLFRDLSVTHLSGGNDQRPFAGQVSLPFASQGTETADELQTMLETTIHDEPIVATQGDWSKPTSFAPTSYQVYEKGENYTPVALTSNTLANTTLSPDAANPLGIFTCDVDLTIGSNVNIQGTLICKKKVVFDGANIQIAPVTMPPTDVTYSGLRIPTIVSGGTISVRDGVSASVVGLVISFEKFKVEAGGYSTEFELVGSLVCTTGFIIEKRTEWDSYDFKTGVKSFMNQPTHTRFPDYLNSVGLSPEPKIIIRPTVSAYQYHWVDPDSPDPLYLPSGANSNFEFELIRLNH